MVTVVPTLSVTLATGVGPVAEVAPTEPDLLGDDLRKTLGRLTPHVDEMLKLQSDAIVLCVGGEMFQLEKEDRRRKRERLYRMK